ncbi:hypothetical protein M9782_16210 [Pectobacterium actinidiae]|uniref:hypothetical protein n=1 Tax=Pectobacterium actinidiae TaxID=1507808 RepID=UPI0023AB4EE6|nr:hypothetical protein [Pectobacterium actinidiae]WEF10732.1 hypothetical protein M9782_16210 [Pectobacterium actinidiae]GLW38289.1 hypothetical protein Pcaca04_22250 [Pectobacterium carotovorum subsp. carotovorum]
MLRHELWVEPDGCQTFCLAGSHGEAAKKFLHPDSKLIWEVEASSRFEAMTRYYSFMNWGEYKTPFAELDRMTYREMGWEN